VESSTGEERGWIV